MSQLHRGILVFSEVAENCAALLGKAHQVAAMLDLPVSAVLLGDSIDAAQAAGLGQWGADRVYMIEDPALKHLNVESFCDALAALVGQVQPELILIGASKRGYELGARLAARLSAGCVSGCVDFSIAPETHTIQARAMLYSGQGIATYRVKAAPAVLLIEPNAVAAEPVDGKPAEVVPFQATFGQPKLQVLEVKPKAAAGTSLEKAPVVVDVGQGVREQGDLALVQQLADQLNAQVSCTRPVSSERGWFPTWLGLSGKRVAPKLCITLGVSGAIQHIVGIRESDIIVAVDSDPESGMLFQADYGVVDDLYQFVPALIEALKARGVRVA